MLFAALKHAAMSMIHLVAVQALGKFGGPHKTAWHALIIIQADTVIISFVKVPFLLPTPRGCFAAADIPISVE